MDMIVIAILVSFISGSIFGFISGIILVLETTKIKGEIK